MDTGKKPQSHGKKVGQGSVNVHKTEQVSTGGKPVGSGQRPSASSGGKRPGGNRAVTRAAGGGGSLLLIVAVAFLLLRSCGGGGSSLLAAQPQSSGQTATVQATVVPTQAPTQAPTTAPTQAPTAAPIAAGTMRDRFYVPGKNDTVTVMVYMCGTDLESNYGMATSDLQEMAAANIGKNVNVIVETGGCRAWKNSIVSSSSNQIYKVESGGVRLLETLAKAPMVETSTLTNFLQYCKANYPADRNILIFWDHGGGSISGYGYDELYKSAGSMDLAEISAALKAGGCTFDWIGFDACLMATLETGLVCADYADYMIASEESEPGTGWYYTNWLTSLSRNTSVDTVTLGKQLIDDFVRTSKAASSGAKVTLSLVDLAEMQAVVPAAFRSFSTATTQMLSGKNYATVSNARASTRQFAQSSRINQIDLVDFANHINTAESRALSQALLQCVKHNNSTISHSYGISIYFPYESTSSVRTALNTYKQVGMDEEYTKCVSSFASLLSSGQVAASGGYGGYSSGSGVDLNSLLNAYLGGGSSSGGNSGYGSLFGSYGGSSSGSYSSYSSPLGALLGGGSYGSAQSSPFGGIDANSVISLLGALAGGRSLPAELDWLDTDVIARNAEYISENYIDPADIFVTIRGDGKRVLSLTDEQWALIQSVELNVFVDDGEGYIDLGLDNYFEFDGNDLLLDWDGTWMTVSGHVAAFYMDSADEDATRGHIPALLNGEFVNLNVVFDAENPDGVITGAQPMYEDLDVQAKGDIRIADGDVIEFLCDYYGYDGDFDSAWKLGEPLTVDGEPEIIYYALDNQDCSVTYRLTDIYNNHYWTPAWVA